jgi:hypothetical protein
MSDDLALEEQQPDGSWKEIDLDGDPAVLAAERQILAEAKSAAAKAKLDSVTESDTDDDSFTRQMLDAMREE